MSRNTFVQTDEHKRGWSRALHPSTSHSLFVTTWIYLNKLPVTSSVAVCIRLVLIFFEPNTIVDMNK